MTSGVSWAVRNEGATLPYDETSEVSYASLSAVVKAALPTEAEATALINGCDCIFGQGYDSNGTLVSGVYFRAKSNGSSNPAGNVIFLPLTNDSYGYYWLQGGEKYLKVGSEATPVIPVIVNATTGSTAAARTVIRIQN
jgi:hypothetical protein